MKMSNQTQIAAVDSPKRHVRGRFRWLGGAVVLVLGVILAGAIYESVSEAADLRAYPPPGQMVDVGGYRLHVLVRGGGQEVTVLDDLDCGTIRHDLSPLSGWASQDRQTLFD